MDGRGRCHDNIFVERLWWTVKHEWVYLRPAANGIEQKRSLAEFFDWYNLQRPHQALGWRQMRLTSANQRQRRHWLPDLTRCRAGAVNLWTVGCADPRLTAQARSPMDKPGNTPCVSPPCPQVGGCPQASQHSNNKTGLI
jgi:putative transposase